MTLELGALIVTGVVSTFDLLVNIATLCFTGTCRSDCCGAHFEHDEESQIQDIKDIIKE